MQHQTTVYYKLEFDCYLTFIVERIFMVTYLSSMFKKKKKKPDKKVTLIVIFITILYTNIFY